MNTRSLRPSSLRHPRNDRDKYEVTSDSLDRKMARPELRMAPKKKKCYCLRGN